MDNRARFLQKRNLESVIEFLGVRRELDPTVEISILQVQGTERTQITTVLRVVRALLSACFLFAPFAMAQEEWQRPELT
jgi:hypothetical protein